MAATPFYRSGGLRSLPCPGARIWEARPLSAPPNRRGEAHLWLLFEEVLAEARDAGTADGTDGWGLRPRFSYVATSLAEAGLVPRDVASAITRELDDALAVRSLLSTNGFHGRQFPTDSAVAAPPASPDAGANWLEAEIERHLDLVASFDPVTRPDAGVRAMEIIGGPHRALTAAGALPAHAPSLLQAFGASLHAAGFPVPLEHRASAAPREEWVAFVKSRPQPLRDDDRPAHAREVIKLLGLLAGADVTLWSLGWSEHSLEVEVNVRPTGGGPPDGRRFRCRATDDAGGIHVGQAAVQLSESVLRFRLRPGLHAGVQSLELRITAGGERAEVEVAL